MGYLQDDSSVKAERVPAALSRSTRWIYSPAGVRSPDRAAKVHFWGGTLSGQSLGGP